MINLINLIVLTPLGCAPAAIGFDADKPGPASDSAGDSAEGLPGDTSDSGAADDSTDTDTADTADEEGWPKDCPEMYAQDDLPTFELDFTDENWARLQGACNNGDQSYFPASFTWNGETVPADVRLKGNWSWNCGKLQFVVSFNEQNAALRFHGVRKMVFDSPWYDRTLLHERLAFPVFQRLGLPYSCANNAKVNVNGEYYGLYANLERLDHEYLERNFEDPDGNLYQAASELKTNEDVHDTSDLDALWAARSVDQIAAVVDLDEATSEWAAEAMIPAMDNYWAGVDINYYVYDYPGRGFLYLPYDLDLSFGDGAYSDGSLVWPDAVNADPITWEHSGWGKEQLFETVLSDPTWCSTYVDKLILARAAYDPVAMAGDVDTWDAQIGDAWSADPRAIVNRTDHEKSVKLLKEFLQDRADVVDAWLAKGGHCPARW